MKGVHTLYTASPGGDRLGPQSLEQLIEEGIHAYIQNRRPCLYATGCASLTDGGSVFLVLSHGDGTFSTNNLITHCALNRAAFARGERHPSGWPVKATDSFSAAQAALAEYRAATARRQPAPTEPEYMI